MKMISHLSRQTILPLVFITTTGLWLSSCRKNTMLVNAESTQSGVAITTLTGSVTEKTGKLISQAAIPLLVYRISPDLPFTTADPETEGILTVPSLSLSPATTNQTKKIGQQGPALRSAFRLKVGDSIKSVAFRLIKGTLQKETFSPQSTLAIVIRTKSGVSVTKLFRTQPKTIDLGTIDLTNTTVLLSGVVSFQSIPLSDVKVKLTWPDGQTTTTTNALGVYEATVPVYQSINLTFSHKHYTQTRQVNTQKEENNVIGVTDLASVNEDDRSLVITGEGIIFLQNDFVAYLQI